MIRAVRALVCRRAMTTASRQAGTPHGCVWEGTRGDVKHSAAKKPLIQVRVLDAAQGVWKPGLALVPAKPAHYGHGISLSAWLRGLHPQ